MPGFNPSTPPLPSMHNETALTRPQRAPENLLCRATIGLVLGGSKTLMRTRGGSNVVRPTISRKRLSKRWGSGGRCTWCDEARPRWHRPIRAQRQIAPNPPLRRPWRANLQPSGQLGWFDSKPNSTQTHDDLPLSMIIVSHIPTFSACCD